MHCNSAKTLQPPRPHDRSQNSSNNGEPKHCCSQHTRFVVKTHKTFLSGKNANPSTLWGKNPEKATYFQFLICRISFPGSCWLEAKRIYAKNSKNKGTKDCFSRRFFFPYEDSRKMSLYVYTANLFPLRSTYINTAHRVSWVITHRHL
jgi:hypothetical protein